MSLHSSQIGGLGAATSELKSTSTHKKSGSASFSTQLKDASTTAETGAAKKKPPAGETTKPIEGHKYADVLTGPRKGLFLNTGSNARAGDTFVMVHKNGREYHIYGTGANRTVIGLKTAAEKKAAAAVPPTATAPATTPPATTTPTGTTDTGKLNTDTTTP
jgi:hypothetical protein